MHKYSIREVGSGMYLTSENDAKYIFGNEEDRILFHDETDAENVLACLNDTTDLCCVLLDEDK